MLRPMRGRAALPRAVGGYVCADTRVLRKRCFLGTGLAARVQKSLDSILPPSQTSAAQAQSSTTNCLKSLHLKAQNSTTNSLKSLHLNAHIFLEKQGAYLVTCANLFQLSGFVCEDVLYLQSLMIFGNGFMALYFLTRMPPLGVAFGWALMKTLVNIFMVFKILHSRQPIALTPQELIAYEEHFMPFGLTAREFKKVWDMGEYRQYQEQDLLIEEGKPIKCLSLVLSGYAYRTSDGKHMACLDTFHGARNVGPDGDAGAWVGATTVLQRLETTRDAKLLKTCRLRDTDKDSGLLDKWKVLFYGEGAETESLVTSNEATVMRLQDTLAALGLYSGEQDGFAGPKTQRALKKLEASGRITLDGVDGPKTEQARETLRETLEQRMGDMNNARWSVHAGGSVIVRVWEMETLLNLCKSSAEIAGTMRKVLSQSVIKKALALHPRRVTDAAPENKDRDLSEHRKLDDGQTARSGAMAGVVEQRPRMQRTISNRNGNSQRDVVLRRYEAALNVALSDSCVEPEDKLALNDFRREHGITEEQHAAALMRSAGWTLKEYECGTRSGSMGDQRISRAAQVLRSYA
mmetsp:Transcript_99410/g.196975  ORF Transcript_99410/g.196975 Transcript_99410/m.196975 type:complete len:576 (-) Transcript_99410:8-1735(-)